MADPLLEIADDLYALPLADFTPARDALAKEHKADKALAAHDGESLRHLAVRPDHWGTGLGGEGFHRAEAAGARRLWVLELNTRARAVYESLGWTPSGASQDCPWPPYPTELEYVAPVAP